MSPKSQILELSQSLIKIKSDPDNSKELEQALELCLSKLKDFTVERFERNGTKSALVYNSVNRPDSFKIILNGHLDIIPGKSFQYIPKIIGDKLFGAGSMDMKSNVATMIYSFIEMANVVNYPLGIQLVTDEETGGFNGTKYQLEQGIKADFVIAGETTGFDIVNQARGVLLLKITGKGKTAHGAYPWKGENAIIKLNTFLADLQSRFPNPEKENWQTTFNLSNIEVNNLSYNKIPEIATAFLDFRFVPNDSKNILHDIQSMIPDDFELEVVANEPALFVEENNEYISKIKSSVHKIIQTTPNLYGAYGTSDSRHYTKKNMNGVEFGPIGGGIGTDDEWVNIPSLFQFYDILNVFLKDL